MEPQLELLSWLAVFTAKTTLFFVLAWLVCRVFRRQGPAFRHLVWAGAFVSVLLLPVMEAAMPESMVTHLTFTTPIKPAQKPEPAPITLTPEMVQALLAQPNPPILKSAPAPIAPERKESINWLPALEVAVWVLGIGFCLGRLFFSYWLVHRVAQNSVTADLSGFEHLLAKSGVRRPCRAVLGSAAPGPMTWGCLRPIIFLPKISANWSRRHLETVLTHELIHVRRNDCLAQEIANLVCALLWFNPAAWLALRQLRNEAEAATDDAVLEVGVKASDYAEALLETLYQTRQCRPKHLLSGVTFMKPSKIDARVRAILTPKRQKAGLTPLGTVLTLGALMAAAVPSAALQAGKPKQSRKTASHSRVKSASQKHLQQKLVEAQKRIVILHAEIADLQAQAHRQKADVLAKSDADAHQALEAQQKAAMDVLKEAQRQNDQAIKAYQDALAAKNASSDKQLKDLSGQLMDVWKAQADTKNAPKVAPTAPKTDTFYWSYPQDAAHPPVQVFGLPGSQDGQKQVEVFVKGMKDQMDNKTFSFSVPATTPEDQKKMAEVFKQLMDSKKDQTVQMFGQPTSPEEQKKMKELFKQWQDKNGAKGFTFFGQEPTPEARKRVFELYKQLQGKDIDPRTQMDPNQTKKMTDELTKSLQGLGVAPSDAMAPGAKVQTFELKTADPSEIRAIAPPAAISIEPHDQVLLDGQLQTLPPVSAPLTKSQTFTLQSTDSLKGLTPPKTFNQQKMIFMGPDDKLFIRQKDLAPLNKNMVEQLHYLRLGKDGHLTREQYEDLRRQLESQQRTLKQLLDTLKKLQKEKDQEAN